ncbi:MAG: nucleotidyltransferase domain-containing protein, partial [Armatimonadetes bacterium]|nr:nucleotidyltransferase domain-containing protein [Armatimonadota bacterium]
MSAVQDYLQVVRRSGIGASRAVLFGSFSREDAGPDSDIDILVIAAE